MSQGTAKEIKMCGTTIRLGDRLLIRKTASGRLQGAELEGEVIELWSMDLDNHLQGRLSCGWCFHDHDEVLVHTPDRE